MDASQKKMPKDDPRIAQLEAQIVELTEQLGARTELAARAQADVQNSKARFEREAQDIRAFASASVLEKLLPTLDNFQRAIQYLPADLKDHEWVKGMLATEQDLFKRLSEMGLTRMQSQGQMVDPARHDVLMVVSGTEGTVVEVVEEGYELHGRVLRPAKIKAGGGDAVQ